MPTPEVVIVGVIGHRIVECGAPNEHGDDRDEVTHPPFAGLAHNELAQGRLAAVETGLRTPIPLRIALARYASQFLLDENQVGGWR